MTAMVGEFPELQGTMGRYYAEAQGEPEELALALEEHYRPRYAGDSLPTTKTGQIVALADKIDTLVGIFAIEQRPTGAKDPFRSAPRRLGILAHSARGPAGPGFCSILLAQQRPRNPCKEPVFIDEVYDFIAERLRVSSWRSTARLPKCSTRYSRTARVRRSTW
jgi:glycyl-tRNA synthetase beta chain